MSKTKIKKKKILNQSPPKIKNPKLKLISMFLALDKAVEEQAIKLKNLPKIQKNRLQKVKKS
jgi:dsDNA-binding SOS-regulon protein